MALATGKTAYVISRRRAFAVDVGKTGEFSVRFLIGKPFSAAEQAELAVQTRQWRQNKGGSGLRCRFVPD